jgi:hypothetical protein
MVYVMAYYVTTAVVRHRRVSEAAPGDGASDLLLGMSPSAADEDEDAELAERVLTRRLLDGALTRGMYRHAMETLASRDVVRQPLRLPRV